MISPPTHPHRQYRRVSIRLAERGEVVVGPPMIGFEQAEAKDLILSNADVYVLVSFLRLRSTTADSINVGSRRAPTTRS